MRSWLFDLIDPAQVRVMADIFSTVAHNLETGRHAVEPEESGS